MKTSILLIHGAWQGAWVWNEVSDLLEHRGFRTRALDLPGSGNDRTPGTNVTLASYAEAIVAEARAMQSERLILVGHSMGGAAITAAASLAPELFSRLIYIYALSCHSRVSRWPLWQLRAMHGMAAEPKWKWSKTGQPLG